MRRVLPLLAGLIAFGAAMPAGALASGTQESILQDDGQLIYASPAHMEQTLEQIASLGVDRVKVSMVWWLVAPHPNARREPTFNASDPAAYPAGAWDRYDTLVRDAQRLGLKVYFELAPPDPRWSVVHGEATNQGPSLGHAPAPRQFEHFVAAVGRRYDGSYVPQSGATPLPRVSYWGLWNEPNERQWLNPWRRSLRGHRRAYIEARLYRGLVDAAWTGLGATGHTSGGDTILLGELANSGVQAPIPFTRALYCVGSRSRPLRGLAATRSGCPTSGNRARFVAANPALFDATGFALHPYGFGTAPDRRYPDPTWITMRNLGTFRRVLAAAMGAYRRRPVSGAQLYLTEWGYITRPPDPYAKTTLAEQQVWLDDGDYMAWKDSYVHAIAQFLLRDDAPRATAARGSRAYWGTFQTGLEYTDGRPKPAFETYPLPIWLPRDHHQNVTVWGQLRVASHGLVQLAQLQFERAGTSSWQTMQVAQPTNPEGFVLVHTSLPAAGEVRLASVDPAHGAVIYSRVVRVY